MVMQWLGHWINRGFDLQPFQFCLLTMDKLFTEKKIWQELTAALEFMILTARRLRSALGPMHKLHMLIKELLLPF